MLFVKAIKRILSDLIIHIKCILFGALHSKELDKNIKKEDKKVFVFLSGFYQNLGDMTITYAHEKFLKECFPQHKIILIPSTDTYSTMRSIKRIINNEDIITVVGGGNMDSEYASLENCRRFVISSFKKNKIVLFPQTMHFSDDLYGRYRLRKTVNTYSKHNNLHIFARESKSYAQMKDVFCRAKTIEATPDMVLYLDFKEKFNQTREGALCVLRNDLEKASYFDEKEIHRVLDEIFDSIEDTDTVNVTTDECMPENYENTIISFLKMVSSKELVVTDRLHCMIFCAITGTPCIAFDNSNKKISSVYNDWLHNLNYISIMDDFETQRFKSMCINNININNDDKSSFLYKEEFIKIKKALL